MGLLLSPLTWILLAGAWLPHALRAGKRRSTSLVFCSLLGAAGLLGAMPLGANLLIGSLERNAGVSESCDAAATPEAVVVLAGGSDRAAVDADDVAALGVASLRRVLAGVALWRNQKTPTLVLVGGASFRNAVADSVLMKTFAESMDVPAGVIRVETTSKNTWENARNTAIAGASVADLAGHIRGAHASRGVCIRARGVSGLRVSDRFAVRGVRPSWLSRAADSAAIKTTQALHEWLGLAYYHWKAFRGDRTCASSDDKSSGIRAGSRSAVGSACAAQRHSPDDVPCVCARRSVDADDRRIAGARDPASETRSYTYYVRTDGGTASQCDGLADAAYPGSGNGHACAWSSPMIALPAPPYGQTAVPLIKGGDTF